jgi:hypothetical protein
MTLEYAGDGSRAWIDAEERLLLRLQPVGREDRRNVTVAELTEGDGDWPGSDPVVVEALGRLTICVIRVAEIDDRALRQFNRLT